MTSAPGPQQRLDLGPLDDRDLALRPLGEQPPPCSIRRRSSRLTRTTDGCSLRANVVLPEAGSPRVAIRQASSLALFRLRRSVVPRAGYDGRRPGW